MVFIAPSNAVSTLAVTATVPYPLPTYNSPRKPSGSKGGLSPIEPVCSAKLDDSEGFETF